MSYIDNLFIQIKQKSILKYLLAKMTLIILINLLWGKLKKLSRNHIHHTQLSTRFLETTKNNNEDTAYKINHTNASFSTTAQDLKQSDIGTIITSSYLHSVLDLLKMRHKSTLFTPTTKDKNKARLSYSTNQV